MSKKIPVTAIVAGISIILLICKIRDFPKILFVKRAVCCACSVICTLKVLGAECVPASGTEDLLFGNVVKTYGDSEH